LAFGAYTAYVHFFAARDYEEVTPEQETSAAPAAPAWDVPAPPAAPAPAEAPAASAAVSEAAPEKAPAEQAAPEKTAGEKPVAVAPQWDVPAAPAMPEEGPAVTQAPSLPEAAVPASAEALVSQPGFDDAAPVTADPAAPVVSPASQDAQPGFVALPEGMHHVEVIADVDECWMGFTPDGRRQQRTLSKGDSYTMTFRDSLVVKLGNAGAVRVIYDGKELERAAAGRVVTLRFPPEE
ncbi:MAG: DUF4115 domain-containing protein, partial [Mailhella sp.]|nr:DUF4115 domain-containing protein [Mailhella sp.]